MFHWNAPQQIAFFDQLKRAFTTAPILAYPDPSLPFRVETDASAFAVGAALVMKSHDGVWRPCAYLSKSLAGAERNWSVYDKELFAIVHAFHSWRPWLLPAEQETEVWCDHQNLSFFKKPQFLTA